MVLLLEITSFALMAAMCYLCTNSDFKSGIISNKVLLRFALAAIAVDAVHYGVFAKGLTLSFLVNVAVFGAVCLLLFYLRAIAGGDCKMAIVASLLFPAECYLVAWGTDVTLVVAMGMALFFGYCFLLIRAIYLLAKGETRLTLSAAIGSIGRFLCSYIASMSYICLIGCVVSIASIRGLVVDVWLLRIACLGMALCVGRFPVLKKPQCFLLAAAGAIVASVAAQTLPVSINPVMWVLVLALMLCQTIIKTSIYERIDVDRLKQGMILTVVSSLVMQSSITKGLPKVSTEDLRSRLTAEEVESVKVWARATRTTTLTVIKKVPFAVFISAGLLLYCILGGVLM